MTRRKREGEVVVKSGRRRKRIREWKMGKALEGEVSVNIGTTPGKTERHNEEKARVRENDTNFKEILRKSSLKILNF